jgi:predicted ferric reductase
MQKKQLGNTAVIILTLLYPILWLTVFGDIATEDRRQMLGEILAGSSMILMGMGMILATKPRWLEDYFGGLDKMYVTHRFMALTAISMLFIHALLLLHFPPEEPGQLMGSIALSGITVLVLLTIAPRIPFLKRVLNLAYHQWRNTHRLLGIFFFLGFIHFTWVEPLSMGTPPGLYMALFTFGGLAAYIYKQVIARFVKRPFSYQIAEINHPTPTITELVLNPTGKTMNFEAGQFQFIHVPESKPLKEPHPFTISSAPGENQLRLAIKASGDWTSKLKQHVKPGMMAKIEGGYGRFNYKHTHSPQVWIAGGIGVTPFRSWVRGLSDNPQYPIHFFYTTRSREDAAFWDEFEQAAQEYPNFNAHLHLSGENGRLTPNHLAGTISGDLYNNAFFLCGPAGLIQSFTTQLKSLNVPSNKIHFEEFNFR